MRYLLLSLSFSLLCLSCANNKKEPGSDVKLASGRLVRLVDFPSNYVSARNVDVWLPEGYDSTQQYQVLYMHDGQMLFDSTKTWNGQEWTVDETLDSLIGSDTIAPTIVVGVWNNAKTRHSDYFPQKPFMQLSQRYRDELFEIPGGEEGSLLFERGVISDGYLKFLVNELKPYIDENFATYTSRGQTFVAGSSMGGLISMYALCEYPEVFGGAACLSTHWLGTFEATNNPIPNEFVTYLAENLPEPGSHKLYFDFGTETLDAYYEPHQIKVDSVLAVRGYGPTDWVTNKFEGMDHSERAWAARLHQPFIFVLN